VGDHILETQEEADRHLVPFGLFWRTLLFDRELKRNGDKAAKGWFYTQRSRPTSIQKLLRTFLSVTFDRADTQVCKFCTTDVDAKASFLATRRSHAKRVLLF